MRRNAFGEAYCHTADELRGEIDEKSDGAVYVDRIVPPEGNTGRKPQGPCGDKASAEVCENESGDTVCHVEADSVGDVRNILREAGVEYTGD